MSITIEKSIDVLGRALAALKQNEKHKSPPPEIETFYHTLDTSIVYVYAVDKDGDAEAVVLRGGSTGQDRYDPGTTYGLGVDGTVRHSDVLDGVMALLKKMDLSLP